MHNICSINVWIHKQHKQFLGKHSFRVVHKCYEKEHFSRRKNWKACKLLPWYKFQRKLKVRKVVAANEYYEKISWFKHLKCFQSQICLLNPKARMFIDISHFPQHFPHLCSFSFKLLFHVEEAKNFSRNGNIFYYTYTSICKLRVKGRRKKIENYERKVWKLRK